MYTDSGGIAAGGRRVADGQLHEILLPRGVDAISRVLSLLILQCSDMRLSYVLWTFELENVDRPSEQTQAPNEQLLTLPLLRAEVREVFAPVTTFMAKKVVLDAAAVHGRLHINEMYI